MDKLSSVGEAVAFLQQAPVDLETFVGLVNALLPRYLPARSSDGKFVSEVNARLVRYFSTQGLVDEPFKVGREARYGERHLLQILAVRKLMAQGHTTTTIHSLLRGADEARFVALIEGSAQPDVLSPSAPAASAPAPPPAPPAQRGSALDVLDAIRRRSGLVSSPLPTEVEAEVPQPKTVMPAPMVPPVVAPSPAQIAPAPPVIAPPPAPASAPAEAGPPSWMRWEVAPGLEIHVRDDYSFPDTPHERDLLVQRVLDLLQKREDTRPALRGLRRFSRR